MTVATALASRFINTICTNIYVIFIGLVYAAAAGK